MHRPLPHAFAFSLCSQTRDEEFETLHWATLLEGAELAFKDDSKKANKCVQASIRAGVPHSKAPPAPTRAAALELMRQGAV